MRSQMQSQGSAWSHPLPHTQRVLPRSVPTPVMSPFLFILSVTGSVGLGADLAQKPAQVRIWIPFLHKRLNGDDIKLLR